LLEQGAQQLLAKETLAAAELEVFRRAIAARVPSA
jgi:hypothetical protein